jgi:hypothetical protein
LAHFEEVEEDCRVDRSRPGEIVIIICKAFENFWGKLEPRSMKGGDITPMPTIELIFKSQYMRF